MTGRPTLELLGWAGTRAAEAVAGVLVDRVSRRARARIAARAAAVRPLRKVRLP